jgi:hypothetical protein
LPLSSAPVECLSRQVNAGGCAAVDAEDRATAGEFVKKCVDLVRVVEGVREAPTNRLGVSAIGGTMNSRPFIKVVTLEPAESKRTARYLAVSTVESVVDVNVNGGTETVVPLTVQSTSL